MKSEIQKQNPTDATIHVLGLYGYVVTSVMVLFVFAVDCTTNPR